jgi:hypothetical protein
VSPARYREGGRGEEEKRVLVTERESIERLGSNFLIKITTTRHVKFISIK